MKRTALAFWGSPLVWLALVAAPSSGQETAYDGGYIYHVEGNVYLQRALEPETEPGEINLPVLPGDRVWTDAGSRAEIHFSDGTILRLDERTKVDVIDLGTKGLLHLWSGSIIVVKAGATGLRIDSPGGSAQTTTEGSYRLDVTDGETLTLSVYDGVAELGSDRGSVVVRRGQRSTVGYGRSPDSLWAFRVSDYDDFDRWSVGQSPGATTSRSTVTRSLPNEVQPYVSELTTYGEWRTESNVGPVWYPTVSTGWAPYRDGRWCYTPYGYTWVSYERWGWAPYHYGRWGYGSYGWFWIPGPQWGPAWVSFAVGPAWIGWSPLGYHGRSVFDFYSVVGRHGYARRGDRHYRGGKAVPRRLYDQGAGWNFVERKRFSRARAAGARLRVEDIDRGQARPRLFEEGAVLNRDLNARAIGSKAVQRDVRNRDRVVRRSVASIGRQARTALRARAVDGNAVSSRGVASPSRTVRAPVVRQTRRPSSSFRSSGTRARTFSNRPQRATRGGATHRAEKQSSVVSRPFVGRRQETRPPARARERSERRRGGREFFERSQRTERVTRTPSRPPRSTTRGRSSRQRGTSATPPSSSSRGIRSGNPARTRGRTPGASSSTTRARSSRGRGVRSSAGRSRGRRK